MSRVHAALIAALGTLMLYTALAFLAYNPTGGRARLDVIYFGAPVNSPRDGPTLVVDPVAIAVWIALIGLYACGVVWLASREQAVKVLRRVVAASVLMLISTLYVAITHPTFLIVTLPPSIREPFFESIVPHLQLLDEIYWHFGYLRYFPWLLSAHIMLAVMVVLFVVRRPSNSSDARAA